MLWLSEREAFQALKRFGKSSSTMENARFIVLVMKVREMVARGGHGLEVEEGFLDVPAPVVDARPVAKRKPATSPLLFFGSLLVLGHMLGD